MANGFRALSVVLALAALAAGVPAAALPCAGFDHCGTMMAAGSGCSPAVGLVAAMSCCEAAPSPAATPAAPALTMPSSKLDPPAAEPALVAEAFATIAAAPAAPVAERSRAEKRHSQGLFALNSVYRI